MDETRIAKVAGRQRGVVTAAQLNAAGLDNNAIRRRCREGRLHRLHQGVYLVGHAVAPEGGAEVAALLACGPASFISHGSAAHLWRLPAFFAPVSPMEVTVAHRERGRRPGIRIHESRTLVSQDVRRLGGIPTTSVARTLLDLAATLPFDDLEVALADARARRLVRDRELTAVLERNGRRRGAQAFRRLIELARERGLTRSEAERRLLTLVRSSDLPVPQVNVRIGGFEVDFAWRSQRVIVEVDGYAFHSSARAFERDRERDTTLAARGYVVLRVTWRQITTRPMAVVARLASALSLRT